MGRRVTKSLEANQASQSLVSWGQPALITVLFQVCGATDQGTDGACEDEAGDAKLKCRAGKGLPKSDSGSFVHMAFWEPDPRDCS